MFRIARRLTRLSFSFKTQPMSPTPPIPYFIYPFLHPPLSCFFFLQCIHAVLLVDVPVSLLFLSVLENHGDAKNQNCVDADNPKGSCEDQVQIAVGVGREL